MIRRKTLMAAVLTATVICAPAVTAQSPQDRYKAFKEKSVKNYNDFRKEANKRYADFILKAWETYGVNDPVEKPERDYIAPEVRYDDGDSTVIVSLEEIYAAPETDGMQESVGKLFGKIKQGVGSVAKRVKRFAENREVKATVVSKAPIAPTPEPIVPAEELPDNVPFSKFNNHKFTFFGTEREVRVPENHDIGLNNISNGAVSKAWRRLSESDFDPLLKDCLTLRDSMNLNDWCYLKMLDALSQSIYGDTNDARMFLAYMFCQSGYMMRLVKTVDGKRLGMFIASPNTLYLPVIPFGKTEKPFYNYNCGAGPTFSVVDLAFDKESEMRLAYNQTPKLDVKESEPRHIRSMHYPDLDIETSVNENLIEFYNSYPDGEIGDNFLTRYAFHADVPLDSCVTAKLYPALKEKLSGMSKVEAANALLNWLQSGFTYQFDNKVWGGDRVFFAEETLFYPFCDCEDRAILYSKLVRDVLGLDVALVHYPGHLATAVCFGDEDAEGVFIDIDGKKYVICDPTLIVGNVGTQMSCVDDSKIQAIAL